MRQVPDATRRSPVLQGHDSIHVTLWGPGMWRWVPYGRVALPLALLPTSLQQLTAFWLTFRTQSSIYRLRVLPLL